MTQADVFTTGGQFIHRIETEKAHNIFRELNDFLNELYNRKNIRRVVILLTVNGKKTETVASYTVKGWTIANI
jgi:hypothetical protein